MNDDPQHGRADLENPNRLRYSVSLVKQGDHQFYTLTMPSEILAQTCVVTTRDENPIEGFQRELDPKRADEIARYIDESFGTIPNSIILSAQSAAELKVVGRGKTLEFNNIPGAFLILDGQHRVFGFSKAETSLRVPVVVYGGLSRTQETRLFIDINTKQKPVPAQLLLDIKRLADIESESEETLRDVFDYFGSELDSALYGCTSASKSARNKITRVTFNQAVGPLLPMFSGKDSYEIYTILNNYLTAVTTEMRERTNGTLLTKPVVFRAFAGLLRPIAQRVSDRHGGEYTEANFQELLSPIFFRMPLAKLEKPGTSWSKLRDYLETRLKNNFVL